MTKQYMTWKNKKKQRLKITNLNDLKQALLQEGYTEIDFKENKFKHIISKNFKVENSVIDMMYETEVKDLIIEDNKIKGLTIKHNNYNEEETIYGEYISISKWT